MGRADLFEAQEHRRSGILAHVREEALSADVELTGASVDKPLVQVGARISCQVLQKQLEQKLILEGHRRHGPPRQHEGTRLLRIFMGVIDPLKLAFGCGLKRGEVCLCEERSGTRGRDRLHPLEQPVDTLQHRSRGHLLWEGGHHAHVSKLVMRPMEVSNVLGLHLPDGRRLAARVERKRMFRAVYRGAERPVQAAPGALGGAHHLVIDRAFFLKPQASVAGLLDDAEVSHFSADLFVGVVRV